MGPASLVATAATLAAALIPLTPAPAFAACPGPGGVSIASAPTPTHDYNVLFRGRGWGHSTGMSQYGTQGAAKLGCTYTQILGRYYPSTSITTRTMPHAVLLRMLDDGNRATVHAESDPVTWQLTSPSASVSQPKGETWSVTWKSGAAVLQDAAGAPKLTAGSGAQLRARHSNKVIRLRTYKTTSSTLHRDFRLRWDYARFAADSAGLDIRQIIEDNTYGSGMDKYLWGLAEIPLSWPVEALKSQIIPARTYAARRAVGGNTELYPTPANQNYGGANLEDADARLGNRWRNAVNATSRHVLVSASGALVDALYSSSHGGRSENKPYAWGGESVSYLSAIDDSRWDMASDNPAGRRAWAVGLTFAQVAERVGVDRVDHMSVAAWGTTARNQGVFVKGVDGGVAFERYYSGWAIRRSLGLLSPGFSIETYTGVYRQGAIPITGDWDGDGDTDFGWWHAGRVALRTQTGGSIKFSYGRAGDIPVVGDWDSDDKDSLGVFRGGAWHLRNAQTSGVADISFQYGRSGDQPVVGNWDGLGGVGVGVLRNGQWFLRNAVSTGPSHLSFRYGTAGDTAVVGDWDRDGDTTIGVRRGATWYLRNINSGGWSNLRFNYGRASDKPVTGDWDRDGTTTVGVTRASTGYLRNTNSGGAATSAVNYTG